MQEYHVYLVRFRPEVTKVEVHTSSPERAIERAKAMVTGPEPGLMTQDPSTVTELFAYKITVDPEEGQDPLEATELEGETLPAAQILRQLRIGEATAKHGPSGFKLTVIPKDDG